MVQVNPGGKARTDEQSNAMIYEGASLRQLSLMFKADPKVVARKCSSLVPVGTRSGSSIYSISEAASRLVKPSYEIERYIMEMNHLDLPSLLSKEFWNGQRSRLAFEEANGDLWRTPDVVRMMAELFSAVRIILLLMPDTVEREAGLSKEQKAIVRRIIDGAIVNGRDNIIKRFKEHGLERHYGDDAGGGGNIPIPEFVRANDQDAGRTGVSGSEEDAAEYNGL